MSYRYWTADGGIVAIFTFSSEKQAEAFEKYNNCDEWGTLIDKIYKYSKEESLHYLKEMKGNNSDRSDCETDDEIDGCECPHCELKKEEEGSD